MNEDAWDEGIVYLEEIKDTDSYCSMCGFSRKDDVIADECTGACEESRRDSFTEELKF